LLGHAEIKFTQALLKGVSDSQSFFRCLIAGKKLKPGVLVTNRRFFAPGFYPA
jgi:hypothetical protein